MILMPLPAADFDPTEAAIPWRMCELAGLTVRFATPMGDPSRADERTLTGQGLGPFARLLRARYDAVEAYQNMTATPSFRHPLPYHVLDAADFDGIIIPGGFGAGMRRFLEARPLQQLIVDFFRADKAVGAIGQGVLLVARSVDPQTGRSVLYRRRTTALLRAQEMLAWRMSRPWAGRYFRTYEEPVEDLVVSRLGQRTQFVRGPLSFRRDTPRTAHDGFAVRDVRYVSARWAGDAHHFAREFISVARAVAYHERGARPGPRAPWTVIDTAVLNEEVARLRAER